MMIFKDCPKTVIERHVYCDSCGTELKIATVTISKPRNDNNGISYEYLCPRCKRIYFLDREYPRLVD